MANKKVVSVLSTAAIGTLIATAVGSTVFAAVDGLVVKNAGSYLNYDLDALKASVVNDALGQAGAELYKDFDAARTAGSIVSYHDDKVGFVDAAAVQKAALDAALAGTNFALDTFTESSKETVLPAAVYQATVTGGKVVAGAEVKPKTAATQAVTVSATGAKTLKVTFAKAVDTTKATVAVKKGAITVNTSSVTWNDAKTEATIVLAGKLSAGDYTVNVTGVETAALSATTTVVDEKVSKIEILSTEAPLVDSATDADANVDDLQVGYRVLNQYGEDITKTTTLTSSDPANISMNQTTGIVTINGDYNTTTNKLSTFTLIDTATATYGSATVTAVSEAKISSVEVVGLYNADKKALTETTNLTSDKFYVELSCKDQYGNVITDAAKVAAELLITESNAAVVNAAANASVITVNGSKKVVVALAGNPTYPTVGKNIVTAIALTSGKSASTTVEVAEGARAYSVDVSAPDITVAGETNYIPVNVTDQDGNAITNLSVLRNASRGVKVTVGGVDVTNTELTIKNGQVYIAHAFAASATTSYSTVMIVSNANQKVDTISLTVKPTAKATIVTGLSSTYSTTVLKTAAKNITVDDLVIEDQYGRVMTSTQINNWLVAAATNKIVVTEDEASTVVAISDAAGDNAITAVPAHATVTATAGNAIGSENITITLHDANGAITSSAKEATLRVTDGTEYASYTVNAVGTVYDEVGATKTDNVAYDKTVKVYGVLADGSKVLLTNGVDYSVSSTNTTFNVDVADGIVDVTAAYAYATDATTKVVPLTVTINATGEKISQDVTISKVAPKVAKVNVVANGKGADLIAAKSVDELGTFNYDSADLNLNFTDLDAVADVVVTDQYGVAQLLGALTGNTFADTTAMNGLTVTFTIVSGDVTFTGNGTSAAAVTVAPVGSVIKVVVSGDGVDAAPVTLTVTQ